LGCRVDGTKTPNIEDLKKLLGNDGDGDGDDVFVKSFVFDMK
jgi:hypothetical protein